jgi:hypothetical protein
MSNGSTRLKVMSSFSVSKLDMVHCSIGRWLTPEQCRWSRLREQADLLVIASTFVSVFVMKEFPRCAVVKNQLQAWV